MNFQDTLTSNQKAELAVGYRDLINAAERCGVIITEDELSSLMQCRFEHALKKEIENQNG